MTIADLFCGAGGTSTGAIEAARACGLQPKLTAVNHWPVAVATHQANHPDARHVCASLDSINPRDLFREGELDLLWASPECTHHSQARGGRPINDQSRATAWCVTRWAEALRPRIISVENVPEFETWGPIGSNGRPLASRKGEVFLAWVRTLEALGYHVAWRRLCAADFGDPTTRERLIVQAVLGRRRIVWPDPTHAPAEETDMLGTRRAWRGADTHVIDWALPMRSIFGRKRPLAANTLRRIREGLAQYGGGKLRPANEPVPTVATSGAISLVLEYYGNGGARPVTQPLPTVTTRDRFALIQARGGDVLFRMLKWHELAAAQGFPRDYRFTGCVQEITKQIGNAVPRRLARALVAAAIRQDADVGFLEQFEQGEAA